MEHGSLRQYLRRRIASGQLSDVELTLATNNWVSSRRFATRNYPLTWQFVSLQLWQIAEGLAYLHSEGLVHGDLHAGNVLVDDDESARITDFGMTIISEGTPYNYWSIHGGGATRWTAPELLDPEEFDLASSRPTFSSDIYAFAMTTILYHSDHSGRGCDV